MTAAQFQSMAVHVLTIVVGAVLMFVGVGCLIASTQQLVELLFEVNQRLPQEEQFEPLGWTLFSRMRLRELQKKLLPQSTRFKTHWRYVGMGFLAFFSGAGMLLFTLR
jgi:hypothetical protein